MDKEKSMLHHCLYFTANALSRILIGANNIRQLEENIGQADLKLAEEDIRALDGLTEVAAPYPVSHLDVTPIPEHFLKNPLIIGIRTI